MFQKPVKMGFQLKRYYWGYINKMFNILDEDRKERFGADRTCAEWILRNGGAIKWLGSDEFLTDYNLLPPAGNIYHIQEVDATDSSIMHYGFNHFLGCKHINNIILHNCSYLEDPALGMLGPINESLRTLQVSHCGNVSHEGLLKLSNLTKLKTLTIFGLSSVPNLAESQKALEAVLPNCSVITK